MKTHKVNRRQVITTISRESKLKLLHIVSKLASQVDVPELGKWKHLSDEQIWCNIVSQVCVMGSARFMERLQNSCNFAAFKSALSLSTLSAEPNKEAYVEQQLANFKATRFKKRAAKRLVGALNNRHIFSDARIVLLRNLPPGSTDDIREELLKRSQALFKRKSASDLMINLGLSDDVIALDQRVVGVLNTYLGYNCNYSRLQASRPMYLSVEDCLRTICKEANITLGQLDRMLFRFAGLTAFAYLISYDFPKASQVLLNRTGSRGGSTP